MIEYKIVKQPDQAYDHFVATHPAGHLFQSYRWGELKRYNGWQPWRIIMLKNNEIIASISFLQHPSYGNNSLFYAPRGPVLDFTNFDLLKQILDKVKEIADAEKAVFLKIDPALEQSQHGIKTNLEKLGFQQVTKQPEETLQQSQVYRINLPVPNNQISDYALNVETSNSLEMLKVFYAILLENSQEMNFNIRSYDYFYQLWQVFQNNGAHLFLLRHKNYVIGGSLVIVFGKVSYSLYNAFRQKYINLEHMNYLHAVIMNWAFNQNCTTYEIINSILPNKKTSTNTRLYTYIGEYDLVYSAFKYRVWNLLVPIYHWSIS